MTRWFVYDLRHAPPSYDFCTGLTMARHAGATGVWLIPGRHPEKAYSDAEQHARVDHIITPAIKLSGLKFGSGMNPPANVCWPPFYLPNAQKNSYSIGWLKSLPAPVPLMPSEAAVKKAREKHGAGRIVVTLRECMYQQERNSSADWLKWAQKHDALVIRDHAVKPIALDDRLALYEIAGVNVGVSGGPFNLNATTPHRPYLMLKFVCDKAPAANLAWFAEQGWFPGDQMPWAGPHQRIVWNSEDDYDTIEREYQEYLGAQVSRERQAA